MRKWSGRRRGDRSRVRLEKKWWGIFRICEKKNQAVVAESHTH